jgi:flavin reductase (DIM6/NTAB) family NADH-FMN oxidoreductase RutF
MGAGEPFAEDGLRLFRVRGSSNYCMPKPRLWAHFAYLAYRRWRFNNNPEIKITPRDAHTMVVFFICPRPVVLVSVRHEHEGNVFPMNLMGPIGEGKFAFALNSTRHAAPIVVKARRAAISNVPLPEAQLAKALGRNHLKASIDLSDLPFASWPSPVFGFPVPDFAVRVRELEIESSERLGSHTLFIARLVHDRQIAAAQEFFYVHGIYQSWRVRNLAALAAR